ncbi:MAG: hypothetical protein WCW14_01460 [Candidatus Paceibacterota bacterium]
MSIPLHLKQQAIHNSSFAGFLEQHPTHPLDFRPGSSGAHFHKPFTSAYWEDKLRAARTPVGQTPVCQNEKKGSKS